MFSLTEHRAMAGPLFCMRCHVIGIETPTIAVGESYFVFIVMNNRRICCRDCLNRIAEQLKLPTV